MTAATECAFEILPHTHILLIWLLLRGTQYGNKEGVIEAANEDLGTMKRPSISVDKEARTEIDYKCIAFKGDYIEKQQSHFHSLVAQSTRG